jgi:hypothetical protein
MTKLTASVNLKLGGVDIGFGVAGDAPDLRIFENRYVKISCLFCLVVEP